MQIPHNKFCVLPWVSLETSPVGTVRPCCLAEDEIVDDSGSKFNLITADLKDIQNSNCMHQLRQAFLVGDRPDTCRKCWNEEDAGRTSKRMHTLDRLKHMIADESWTSDAKPLMFLDLKLGNICNLKCRICGSWSSSTFAAEELTNILDRDLRKKSFHYEMLKQGAWPKDNKTFWPQINAMLGDIRYIEFTGGEPFMIQEHFDLLENIVESGHAHKVEIHYNTNGTQYPAQAENIWRHFRHVEIAFSIDDTDTRFEYQRTNAVWTEVVHNLALYRDLKNRSSNMSLQVCCTINAYNICHLDNVANWIQQQNFDFVYWNILHEPWYLSISCLPAKAKKSINDMYKNKSFKSNLQNNMANILEFMNNGTDSDGQDLIKHIVSLDHRRGHNLRSVDPLLCDILELP